ncbi:MAG: hypothetical protein RMX62_09370 [Planktomarina sp.]|nr:hypothetical protein [Planktomarina sp.]
MAQFSGKCVLVTAERLDICRIGLPEEIAALAVCFGSDESTFTTVALCR